jgi:hypothetical protein
LASHGISSGISSGGGGGGGSSARIGLSAHGSVERLLQHDHA